MSARLTIHAEYDNEKTACGLRGLAANRLSSVPRRVTCRRCRQIAGLGETWAQKQARERKPPKRAAKRKHSDLVELDAKALEELKGKGTAGEWFPNNALSGRLQYGEAGTVIDSTMLRALKECDGDPRRFPLLRYDRKGEPTRDVPNPLYVSPSEAMAMPYGRAKTRALNHGLDELHAALSKATGFAEDVLSGERLTKYMSALEAVFSFASELCDAVDMAEEDVGGARPMKDIIGDLGPAVSAVDSIRAQDLSRKVQDENGG